MASLQTELNLLTTRVGTTETDIDSLQLKTTAQSYLEGVTSFASSIESNGLVSNNDLIVYGNSQLQSITNLTNVDVSAPTINIGTNIGINNIINIGSGLSVINIQGFINTYNNFGFINQF